MKNKNLSLVLLNTSIVTADGDFTLRTISLEEAKKMVAESENVESAVGHQGTADIMSKLLG